MTCQSDTTLIGRFKDIMPKGERPSAAQIVFVATGPPISTTYGIIEIVGRCDLLEITYFTYTPRLGVCESLPDVR